MRNIKFLIVVFFLFVSIGGYTQSKGYGGRYTHSKAKAAYEGTWKYRDNAKDLDFIIRLTCLYRLTTQGDTLTEIVGIYSLSSKGVNRPV